MKTYRQLFVVIVIFFTLSLEAQTPPANLPPDVHWVRYSVEYPAICIQTYRWAWETVKAQADTVEGDWAVILDIDETVLDNSRYQEILFETGEKYPYFWDDWVRQEECPPVPGVKTFLDSVHTLGEHAHVVFITNRKIHLEEATLNNLRKVGLWREGDVLLCRRDKSDTKILRRKEVREGTGRCEGMGKRKILALIGDQLADVMEYPTPGTVLENKTQILKSPDWGTRYFLLPNPMYGYWQLGYPSR